jgi:hypothetical protein
MKWYGANRILLICFAWLLRKGSMRLELAWGFFLHHDSKMQMAIMTTEQVIALLQSF